MVLYIKDENFETTTVIIGYLFNYFNYNLDKLEVFQKQQLLTRFTKIMSSIKYLAMNNADRFEKYSDIERLTACAESIQLTEMISNLTLTMYNLLGNIPSVKIEGFIRTEEINRYFEYFAIQGNILRTTIQGVVK